MASKRTFDEKDNQNNDDRDFQICVKRRHVNTDLEPLIRKVVIEVLEEFHMLQGNACPCSRLSLNWQSGSGGGRAMQLCFVNGLPQEIFTQAQLTAENGDPLQIELRNAATQQRVVTGEVSSMKVEICVLHGDFDEEEWTAEEFNAQTVKPRERKGPLLTEAVIQLEKGVASINNKKKMMFTDNSSWTRSKKFCLGVRPVQPNSDIKEGRTESFRILDKRGEKNKKPERPSLNDEVWRLRGIGEGSPLHKDHEIKTVKDLLRFDTTGALREKFGNKYKWDKIIKHAKGCELDSDERYTYTYHPTEQLIPVTLVLNCIYEVEEVFYGQRSLLLPSLNLEEKRLVKRVTQEAYKNLHNLKKLTPCNEVSLPVQQQPGEGAGQFEMWNQFENNYPWYSYSSFPCGDGPSSSIDHFFYNNTDTAEYIPIKGKRKTVWQQKFSKIRNALKWLIPHMAKNKPNFFYRQPPDQY